MLTSSVQRSPDASWHADYRDTAYIYIGGLSFEMTEGDVISVFSQFGEPVYINLVRDKETGKSKGFAFLKYEDQRSTDLAVDNLGGATVLGRVLRVDHTRYKRKEDEDLADNTEGQNGKASKEATEPDESDGESLRPLLKEERELVALIKDHDEDDPMKEYLIQEKRDEVTRALERLKEDGKGAKDLKRRRHHHRHHHSSHRSRREDSEEMRHRCRKEHRDR